MNKAHLMVAAFSLVMGSILLLPALNIAFAQYGSQGAVGSATLEEQLQLAKEKITNAQQQGAYGSGTNLDNTVLMIIIIVVIMGGISAAFFAAGKSGTKRAVVAGTDGSHTSGKFCTNCGTQLGDGQKFCGNCGTKS
jgi:hypothetical protein